MSLPTPPGPQQPPGAGCVPWGVEGVERGRGVAQAVVQELWCPQHPREHLMAPAFALRSGTRDTANVGQEGGTVPEELWGPSLNTRCCLIPWGWRPPWPAGTGSLGTAEGRRSRQRCGFGLRAWSGAAICPRLPPTLCHPGRMRGWQLALGTELPHTTRTPQAPCSFPPLPAFALARNRESVAPLPSGRDPVLGGSQSAGTLLAPCSQQLPCAQPLPHGAYGHFLNSFYFNIFVI